MYIAQLDKSNAFLNYILNKNVSVMSQRGTLGTPSRCYKLLEEIYGLKKAHMTWLRILCGDLHRIGFNEFLSAPCVFRRNCKSEVHCFVFIYVDDLLIFAQTQAEIRAIFLERKSIYVVCVSGNIDMFLGYSLNGS